MGHGGSRKGAGRKKGTSVSAIISSIVDEKIESAVSEIMKNNKISEYIIKEHSQLSLDTGWIYLIKNKENNKYKVGYTSRKNLNTRLSLYKTHFIDIELIYSEKVNYVKELEQTIHDFISTFDKGDWFIADFVFMEKFLKTISKHR